MGLLGTLYFKLVEHRVAPIRSTRLTWWDHADVVHGVVRLEADQQVSALIEAVSQVPEDDTTLLPRMTITHFSPCSQA
jgi:hypothetical protein